MSWEDIVKRGKERRDTSYLDPHEMTREELLKEKANCEHLFHRFTRYASQQRERMALCSAELSKPNRFKEILGGGKTTPRKKICRIHEWDKETNKRIRGHKYDHRQPSLKAKIEITDNQKETVL